MNYRGYDPQREIVEKHIKETISAFSHVAESATPDCLSKEDLQTIERIQYDLEKLKRKLSTK